MPTSQSNNTAYLNDKTGPTMTITAANSSGTAVSDGATTNDSYLVVTFTSNETTTNFALADITVSVGSMASFSEAVPPILQILRLLQMERPQ